MYINTANYDETNLGKQGDYTKTGGTVGYNGLMEGFPELEAGANKTSGYDSIWNDPEYGQVPQATMDAYWEKATKNAMDKSRGAYASIFGERGMAPSGVGSQAEMLSRRGTELEETRAGANVENAAQGARAKAAAKSSISGNRYKVLTDPVEAYYRLQQGLGERQAVTMGNGTVARPTTPAPGGTATASTVGAAQRPQGAGAAPLVLPTGGGVQVQEPTYPTYDNGGVAPGSNVMPAGVSPTYGTADTQPFDANPYGTIYQPMDNRTPDTYAW